jgi:hypothetical protein
MNQAKQLIRSLAAAAALASSVGAWAQNAAVPCQVHNGNELKCAFRVPENVFISNWVKVNARIVNREALWAENKLPTGQSLPQTSAAISVFQAVCDWPIVRLGTGYFNPQELSSRRGGRLVDAGAQLLDSRLVSQLLPINRMPPPNCTEVFIHSCSPVGCESLKDALVVSYDVIERTADGRAP